MGCDEMNEQNVSNYELAKQEADLVDQKIIETLQSGESFLVEAGAGSGKTYSLMKAIEWIQANKYIDYQRKRQNVICITYTNVAVNVIETRLKEKSFILPSTIHSFAWSAIKQYQSTLLQYIIDNPDMCPKEGDIAQVKQVQYSLGHRYIEKDVLFLHHSDVIRLFEFFLDNVKFRKIFSDKYPLILIDEYQDSFKSITDRFISYFIDAKQGPQFGFFGDAWQTIYQMNKPCGAIDNDKLVVIKKGSNFRSAKNIVNVLNKIRPSLPQISAIDNFDGEVFVVNCNDYKGIRRSDRGFKGELPTEELNERLNRIRCIVRKICGEEQERIKSMMITHKILSRQQGYEELLDIIGDRLKDAEDIILLFFMNTVEPIYNALCESNMELLFNTLGINRFPINSKSEKTKWNLLKKDLDCKRKETAIEVLATIINSGIIPIPPNIEKYYSQYQQSEDSTYENGTIKQYLSLPYSQFLSAIAFLFPNADFSTEHGVKGEEYDNVIFTLSKGWNNYQFDVYMPMNNDNIPSEKRDAYERNRNLFYVCCSRAKKRLVMFITYEFDDSFKSYLVDLVGPDNYYEYDEFIAKYDR